MIQTHPNQIGKYKVDSLLGQGAMGVVYKAYDEQIERWVAIKVLHEELKSANSSRQIEESFLQEAKAAARCQHPNITTIFDFGYDQQPYIVMEFIEGTELKAFLKQKHPFSVPAATNVCHQILSALAHAHSQQVVHRDIKPANVILLPDGQVKVMDFGVAHIDPTTPQDEGFVMGTPVYMSPEGLAGLQTDERSDLYSLAVVYYELLTQCRPNKELTLEQNLDLINDLTGLSTESAGHMKDILRKALNENPQQRYQSADQFGAALKELTDIDLTHQELYPTPASIGTSTAELPVELTSKLWNQELLFTLETSLARHLGPVAKHLVRRTCDSSGTLDELLADLSMHIPSDRERRQFVRTISKAGFNCEQEINTLIHSANPIPKQDDQEQLQTQKRLTAQVETELRRLLTYYLGPLAGRMIVKHSRHSDSLCDLINALSRQIPNPKERSQFVQRASSL